MVVNVVWPRAMNFLNQLKECIFLFTGSKTVSGNHKVKHNCKVFHLFIVRDTYIFPTLLLLTK